MSERILKALMQLFAIICDVEDISWRSRDVVESFLKQQLSQDLVDEYLKIFDEYLEQQKGTDSSKKRKRTAVNSVKVLRICTQINEELTQKQKIIVLLRLLEFIYSGDIVTEQEKEFLITVAETFNVDIEEFELLEEFVKLPAGQRIKNPNVLVLSSRSENNQPYKHLLIDGLQDEIHILRIKSVGLFAFRYFGKTELLLNGQAIIPEKIYIFTQGSSLRSSKIQPIYYSDIVSIFLSETNREKIIFKAVNLTYKFKKGNYGLHPFNFYSESGKMVGIMGASGAGKSTLLNLLNGTYHPTTGRVTINGIDIHKEPEKIEGVIGYVSQDDLLIEELTVFENLFYNAKLCFADKTDEEITQLVNDTLINLGLYEAKDLKVGSPLEKTISGGQRKRLNIALELIREPSVLFVDEPTSGLSSRDSENIMDLLKELALKGKLVFVVIHQPSSDIFKMFDQLIILDTGGYPIYNGNPIDAVIYFKKQINHVNSDESECQLCGNVNPEQIFNIIETKVLDEYGNPTLTRKIPPREWYAEYLKNIERKISLPPDPETVPKSNLKIPNFFRQWKVFTIRDILSKLANKQYMYINLLEAPLLAFILSFLIRYYNTDKTNIIGYIYRENENLPAYLFMCVIVALFLGMTVSAEEIFKDRKIRKREKFLNLSNTAYLFSKIFIMFLISFIQTWSFLLVGNSILEIKGMWWEYFFLVFTTSCFANMLGLNISSAFNSAVTIYILIPFMIIPQLILSGVIVKFEKLNPMLTVTNSVPLAGEMMTSRWAFEALAVKQFKDNMFEKIFYKYDYILKNSDFKKNFLIPKLREKLSNIKLYMITQNKEIDPRYEWTVFANTVREELEENPKVPIGFDLDKVDPEKPDEIVLQKAENYLNELNRFYIRQYNLANEAKDAIIVKMTSTPEDKEKFIRMKDQYTNDALTDLVTNKNEFNKIIEKDGRIYRLADPIFMTPKKFRAHFFAPHKKIFNKYADTFYVNIMVIWLMSLTLYVTLYFDIFRKIVNYFGK